MITTLTTQEIIYDKIGMNITPLRIFSLFHNCKEVFEKHKDLELDGFVNRFKYMKQPEYIRNKCTTLMSFINSGHFTYQQLKLYFMNHYLFNEKLNWKHIIIKDISKISSFYTKKQLEIDKKFILQLNKRVKFSDINTFYRVNSDGSNVLLDLILNGNITPMFYIEMFDDGWDYEKQKYEESEKLTKFNRTIKIIQKQIKK